MVMERRFDTTAHVRHCRRLASNPKPNHNLLIEVPVMMNSRIVEDKDHNQHEVHNHD